MGIGFHSAAQANTELTETLLFHASECWEQKYEPSFPVKCNIVGLWMLSLCSSFVPVVIEHPDQRK